MTRSRALIIILLVNFSAILAQVSDPGFAKYLNEKGYYSDLLQLDKLDKGLLNIQQKDSLHYYSAWACYNLQLLERGIKSFSSVSRESTFFNASRFFATWSEFYLGQTQNGIDFINQTLPGTSSEQELLQMFKTSAALLENNTPAADSLLRMVRGSSLIYAPQWERMELHYNRLVEFKPKSYLMAGLLSGVLPGAGKIYAGQKGAGTSSLLLIGAMAAVTLENGYKTGWKRWNTLLAASVFSVFYVGNIYGSIVSVKVYRERFFDELDRAILLDINIPLRNIYR